MKNLCYCALEVLYILVAVVDVCSIGIAGYAVSLSCGYPQFAVTCIQTLCLLSACVFLFSGFSVYISVKEGVPQIHVLSIKRAMRVVVCFSLLTLHLLIVLSYYNSASLLFWSWRKLFVIACLCETCILFPVVFYAGFAAGNPMEYVLKYLETQKSKRSRLPERCSVEDRTGVACIAVVTVLALLLVALMMHMKM